MLDEPFARGDSPIHRLDPRSRVAMIFFFTVAVALCRHLAAPLAALGVGVILMSLARLDPLAVGRRLLAVNFFIFFLWLVLPFSLPGTPVLTLGPLTATRQGMALALLVTVKSTPWSAPFWPWPPPWTPRFSGRPSAAWACLPN